MIAQIAVGQTAPVIVHKEPGAKTVYIRALDILSTTWFPVALDLEVTLKVKTGSVFTEKRFPLPNAGLKLNLVCDELYGYVRYVAAHALSSPAQYNVMGDCVLETDDSEVVMFETYNAAGTFPISGVADKIPDFCSRFKIETDLSGYMVLHEFGSGWNQLYDFAELRRFIRIPPIANSFLAAVLYLPFGYTVGQFTLEWGS